MIVLVGCAILIVFLFVGVGLTGIIAAIFIPRHLDTLHKAKQQRAIAELHRMGTAIELYKTEHGYAPAATDVNGLAEALGTVDGAAISRLDPWQHPYRYACWQENAGARGCDHYRIASAGADGRFEQSDLRDYTFARFPRLTYDHDIVFGDGAFVTSPLNLSERPWVFLNAIEPIEIVQGQPIAIHIGWENTGDSPALNVTAIGGSAPGNCSNRPTIGMNKEGYASRASLSKGQGPFTGTIYTRALSSTQVAAITAGTMCLFVSGGATYSDALAWKTPKESFHHTRFCSWYNLRDKAWSSCPWGNTMD